MSLVDAPMALFDRILGRAPTIAPDDPIARALQRLSQDLEPDSPFQQRLRGRALNRFVAAREGLVSDPMGTRASLRRRMTPIGRAVLVTSVVMASGAASVAAASQSALPGDVLYSVKLRIEELRIEIAPVDLRTELVVASLDARLAEIQTLAGQGEWTAVEAVAGRAVDVAATLEGMTSQVSPATEIALAHHVSVLESVVADAPTSAVAALQHALEASTSAASTVSEHGWRADGGEHPGYGVPAAGPADASSPQPTVHPTPRGESNRGTGSDSNNGDPGSNSGNPSAPGHAGAGGAGSPAADSSTPEAAGSPPPGPQRSSHGQPAESSRSGG